MGISSLWIKLYQGAIEAYWHTEPPGYRSAVHYIKGGQVSGAAQLLAMLMGSSNLDPASLLLLAKAVLPNGNSAFTQKPEIPTSIVGTPEVLDKFYSMIPAPNETYNNLLWLGDTAPIDSEFQRKKAEEKAAKKNRTLQISLTGH